MGIHLPPDPVPFATLADTKGCYGSNQHEHDEPKHDRIFNCSRCRVVADKFFKLLHGLAPLNAQLAEQDSVEIAIK